MSDLIWFILWLVSVVSVHLWTRAVLRTLRAILGQLEFLAYIARKHDRSDDQA